MNSLITSISIILASYISKKNSELLNELGPEALDVSKDTLNVVTIRLLLNSDTSSIAHKFQESPEIYRNELELTLSNLIESDPEFEAKLKNLSDRYTEAIKKHAESIEAIYQADLGGTGSIAQGRNAIAVTATDKGLSIGAVRGNVTFEGNRAIETDIYIEKNIEGTSQETKQNIAQIRFLEELKKIDGEWEKERVQYLSPDNNGNLNKEIPSYRRAIFIISIGIIMSGSMLLFSFSLGTSFESDERHLMLIIASILIALITFFGAKNEYINFKKYKLAENAYLDRRASIKQSNFEQSSKYLKQEDLV